METPSLPNFRYMATALTKLVNVFQMVPGPPDLKEIPVYTHSCFPGSRLREAAVSPESKPSSTYAVFSRPVCKYTL